MYVVAKDDSLWSIAQKFHTTTAKLEQANNLTDSSTIYPGQKLVIP